MDSEKLSVHRETCRWQRIRNTPFEEEAESSDIQLVKSCNLLLEEGGRPRLVLTENQLLFAGVIPSRLATISKVRMHSTCYVSRVLRHPPVSRAPASRFPLNLRESSFNSTLLLTHLPPQYICADTFESKLREMHFCSFLQFLLQRLSLLFCRGPRLSSKLHRPTRFPHCVNGFVLDPELLFLHLATPRDCQGEPHALHKPPNRCSLSAFMNPALNSQGLFRRTRKLPARSVGLHVVLNSVETGTLDAACRRPLGGLTTP
jgi:hypothetical protein